MSDFENLNFENYINNLQEGPDQSVSYDYGSMKYPSMYEIHVMKDGSIEEGFMEFVLREFFYKNLSQTEFMMAEFRNIGIVVCGSYTKEVAETKLKYLIDFSKDNFGQVKCVMQKSEKNAFEKP